MFGHSYLAGSFTTGEPHAFALGSRGLGEVDSDLYLVVTSWPPGLRPQAYFSGALVHFHVQVLWGGRGPWATALRSRGTCEVIWPLPSFEPLDPLGTGPRHFLGEAFHSFYVWLIKVLVSPQLTMFRVLSFWPNDVIMLPLLWCN